MKLEKRNELDWRRAEEMSSKQVVQHSIIIMQITQRHHAVIYSPLLSSPLLSTPLLSFHLLSPPFFSFVSHFSSLHFLSILISSLLFSSHLISSLLYTHLYFRHQYHILRTFFQLRVEVSSPSRPAVQDSLHLINHKYGAGIRFYFIMLCDAFFLVKHDDFFIQEYAMI